jgi:hypothetical protein
MCTALLTGIAAAGSAAAPTPARAGEMGAFITLINTYAYPQGPRKGNRLLIKSRVALPVLDQAFDEGDRLWYQVLLADRSERAEGVGWTPLSSEEILSRGSDTVQVYSRPLDAGFRAFQSLAVPATDLELAHETQRSEEFPQVEWQKVRYAARQAVTMWVRGTAGVYRVGRSPAFLSQSYAEMATRTVSKAALMRLLSGVVRIGDTPQEVRWALGDPLRTGEEASGTGKVTVWEFPEAVVRFESAVVKQVE